MRPVAGLSLLEIVISVALLALVVVFVLNLLPTSALSLQHADDVQAATAYGQELLDDARLHVGAGMDLTMDVTLNHSVFHVTRRGLPVTGTTLVDVIVHLQGPRGTPVTLGTRLDNAP